MASAAHTTPELRAYPIFEKLPEGCFAHPVSDDDNWPILRAGEFVVVDPNQTEPVLRELFVVNWSNGTRRVAETRKWGSWDGIAIGGLRRRKLMTLAGGECGEPMLWNDGPYPPEHLREKLAGRVIGILEPSFDETRLRRVN